MTEQAPKEPIEGEEPKEPQGTDWKAEARKWEERAKANKAKADQWDAAEEANKTELQKLADQNAKYKAQLDGIKAEKERMAKVEQAAKAHKVDAALLGRMSGDVEDNAAFLAEIAKQANPYPTTRDKGETPKAKAGDPLAETAHLLFGKK